MRKVGGAGGIVIGLVLVVLAAAVVLVAVFWAETDQVSLEDRRAEGEALASRPFALGERRFAIELPAAAAVTALSSNRVVIDFRPGTRSPSRITLSATPPDPAAARRNALSAYRDWEKRPSLVEGGSGGPEASLDGWVSLDDGGRLQFSCVTQGEWIDISAAHWCEPFLEMVLDRLAADVVSADPD